VGPRWKSATFLGHFYAIPSRFRRYVTSRIDAFQGRE
jgi:hypothetical protein